MKSKIEESVQIPEMYILRHKHDNIKNDGYNYQDNLLPRTLSPVLYKNNTMSEFLKYLNNMTVIMIDTIMPVRNIFFYSHNKYFNGHGK